MVPLARVYILVPHTESDVFISKHGHAKPPPNFAKHPGLEGLQMDSFPSPEKSEFFSKNTYHRIAVDSDHFCLNSSIG